MTKIKTLQWSNVNAMNLTKQFSFGGIYSSLEEAFDFCWSSFADEHNTLPKSTKRNVILGDPGADKGGEGKSKRVEKYM